MVAHGMMSDGGVPGSGPLRRVFMEKEAHCCARR